MEKDKNSPHKISDSGFKDSRLTKPEKKKEKEKPSVKSFFGKVGYSVWIIVMVVGGILAFLVSLLLL